MTFSSETTRMDGVKEITNEKARRDESWVTLWLRFRSEVDFVFGRLESSGSMKRAI